MRPFSLEKSNEIAATVAEFTNIAVVNSDNANTVVATASFNVEAETNRGRGFKLF